MHSFFKMRVVRFHCSLLILIFSFFFSSPGVADQNALNPYAPPVEMDITHPRNSCATLGYRMELGELDQKLRECIVKIEKLANNPNHSHVEVFTNETTKKNGRNKTRLTIIHVPEKSGIEVSEASKVVQTTMYQLETIFKDIKRRPVGDFISAKSIACGLYACFRIASTVLPATLIRHGVEKIFLLESIPEWLNLSNVTAGATLVGITIAGVETMLSHQDIGTRQDAHRNTLSKAKEDIKNLTESANLENQDSHFILITKASS